MREKGRPAGQNNVGQVIIEADRQTDRHRHKDEKTYRQRKKAQERQGDKQV